VQIVGIGQPLVFVRVISAIALRFAADEQQYLITVNADGLPAGAELTDSHDADGERVTPPPSTRFIACPGGTGLKTSKLPAPTTRFD